MRPATRAAVAAAVAGLLAACSGRGGSGGGDLSAGTRPGGDPAAATASPTTASPTTVPASTTAAPTTTTVPAATATTARPATVPPSAPPPPPAGPDFASVEVALTPVASLEQPVAMAVRSGDAALYVAEKTGRVRAIRDGQVDPTPVLSLAGQVAGGFEQGLLGLAFSPDGSRLYVDLTDPAGDTHVVEYQMSGGRADPATARQLLFVEQPFSNHNGGQLVVTADGRLWIALGDGGSGGDPQDNAQSLNRLLGKILRIDPLPSGGQPYTVPPDNPFVGRPASRPEVWAYGLRNPWRFSFDRATGDLWIADVGQSAREEINFVAAGSGGGQNFGWARMEGTLPYAGTPPPDAVAPIFDYARSGGNCSVTGGYVYRGSRIPGLVGAYLFADFCLGRVRALRQSGGQVTAQRTFAAAAPNVTSFGQDQAGELYVLSLEGGVYRIDPA